MHLTAQNHCPALTTHRAVLAAIAATPVDNAPIAADTEIGVTKLLIANASAIA
jgi:hypothetical protein